MVSSWEVDRRIIIIITIMYIVHILFDINNILKR